MNSSLQQKTSCVKCGKTIALDGRLMVGEIVHCGQCRAQLEVVELAPLVLEPRAKIEEDEEDFADR